MTDGSAIYRRVATQMHDAFRAAGAGIGVTWTVRSRATPLGWLPPLVRIEYIWSCSDLAVRTAAVRAELGSDHPPVYATFTMTEHVSAILPGRSTRSNYAPVRLYEK